MYSSTYGEILRYLRRKRNLTMKELGAVFSLAESTISGYENETRKPDLDILRKFAEFYKVTVDFIINGFDKEITERIKNLSNYNGSIFYFSDETLSLLNSKLEPLKKEYYDVPLDLEPMEMIGLLKEFPLSTEFKKDFLDVLIDVKAGLEHQYDSSEHFNTIAAHHEGEEWTEEELEELEKFKDYVRSKRK